MNKTAKKLWLKALRSGEYEQGRGRLCDPEGRMCCLGVLYDVAVDGYWAKCLFGWKPQNGYGVFLHDNISRPIGISKIEQIELASMNDDGKSFAIIADWIEKRL